jgi:hypothetical protein
MRSLIIKFDTDLVLRFVVENHAIADLWLERFQNRHAWPMDDASRFYGLRDPAIEKQRAHQHLDRCITVINAYQPIIDLPTKDFDDQDTLNYLHSRFEKYHGLLDQQHGEWWQSAPDSTRKALADLNIAVHRMESANTNLPRIVCTWFGMPKDHVLDPALMRDHGTLTTNWGGVYLNYVEIGKTMEDLATDDDQWISDDAFQPFRHYSADFNVRFYDREAPTRRVENYWLAHRDFFQRHGVLTWNDPAAFPYRFKVAQLVTDWDQQALLAQLSRVNNIVDTYLE